MEHQIPFLVGAATMAFGIVLGMVLQHRVGSGKPPLPKAEWASADVDEDVVDDAEPVKPDPRFA